MAELERTAANNKILIIGVDGMDPDATSYFLSQGEMPNVQKLLDAGAANKTLGMLGSHPTGTPPMWTTLATGANPNVHGISDFSMPSDKGLEWTAYGFDSRDCKAEQLWNVFAEAGKKTLVFHWPGSAWPPTSDNPLLNVVDGTQPEAVNAGVGQLFPEYFVRASEDIAEVEFIAPGHSFAAPCAIDDIDADAAEEEVKIETLDDLAVNSEDTSSISLTLDDGFGGWQKYSAYTYATSPIKEPKGWATDAPEGAKEFTLLTSGGALRHPALILKNEAGVYDTVVICDSKKSDKVIVTLSLEGGMAFAVEDEDMDGTKKVKSIKNMRLLELAEDGSSLRMYVTATERAEENTVWWPKRLHEDVVANVGYPTPTSMVIPEKEHPEDVFNCLIEAWNGYVKWHSAAMQYLIDNEGYDVVFSHCHNVDAQMHVIVKHLKTRDFSRFDAETAAKAQLEVYRQTDRYVGSFLHYLDEGWTIFLVSDHGLVCPEHDKPQIGEGWGVFAGGIMQDYGFTVPLKDEDGNDMRAIDWTKSVAIQHGTNFIYINLKGRDKHTLPDGTVIDGLVDPADKYELEEKIITALYDVKDAETGNRVISVALRNREAVLLGEGGENFGDIIFYTAEGYNDDHFESLSTVEGVGHTSVKPIMIAAGPGIKKGVLTDRIIREADFCPTVAVVGGVRMPEQCEGAPVYQILDKLY